ncbi:MAG: hypothetical protein ACO2ZX_02835, partial [Paracoccaceae bacterium]
SVNIKPPSFPTNSILTYEEEKRLAGGGMSLKTSDRQMDIETQMTATLLIHSVFYLQCGEATYPAV